MTWVRIDDGAVHHEKLLAAGPDAITLWLSGLCYANRHTTDGALARGTLLALYPSETLPPARAKKAAARLVEVGLWLETASGWCIRNYERYQREAMAVTRDRRREADKASKAEKRGTKSTGDPPPVGQMSESDKPPTHGRSESEPKPVEVASAPSRAHDPVPSRPVPSRSDQAKRNSRASADAVAMAFATEYGARFKAVVGRAWMHPDQLDEVVRGTGLRSFAHIRDQLLAVASVLLAQEDPEGATVALADAWFRDPFAARCEYALAALAKNPARVLAQQPLHPPGKHEAGPDLTEEDFLS